MDTVCDSRGVATSDRGYGVAELSIKSFPEDLLKRLKVQAALEGITLRNLVTQMLEAQYNRRKPAK